MICTLITTYTYLYQLGATGTVCLIIITSNYYYRHHLPRSQHSQYCERQKLCKREKSFVVHWISFKCKGILLWVSLHLY